MNARLTLIDFAALSPLLIILFGSLLMLLLESFLDKFAKKLAFPLTLITLLTALFAAVYAPISENPLLTPWLHFDSLTSFFTLFFICIGLGTTLLSSSFFKQVAATQGEYYFFLLASLFGLILIGASADFLTLFLGLETLSISLYIWCGYIKKWQVSHESAIKYFLMGALATAFLVYGIALIYGATGTTRLSLLLGSYQKLADIPSQTLFLSGIALVTLGLAFKAAIVPFHVWAPDVYEGAPTPVTAFMAVGTKVGAFAAFVRIFLIALPQFDLMWNEGIALLAYPTLIYANFVALRQTQFRRFFAYSGISHAGFLLIPLAAGGPEALSALLFYLVVYAIATLGAFAGLTFLDHGSRGPEIDDLRGLFKRSPYLAALFAVTLLTLAGIPPTAGFFAKFYLFQVAFQAGYYGLVIVGLSTTVLAAYYYLRIIALMFSDATSKEQPLLRANAAVLVGGVAFAAILILSFYPAPFMNLIRVT